MGLAKGSNYIIDISFDILSLEALFLVPRSVDMSWTECSRHLLLCINRKVAEAFFRICSLMSLNPYFGSLIPVLKVTAITPVSAARMID